MSIPYQEGLVLRHRIAVALEARARNPGAAWDELARIFDRIESSPYADELSVKMGGGLKLRNRSARTIRHLQEIGHTRALISAYEASFDFHCAYLSSAINQSIEVRPPEDEPEQADLIDYIENAIATNGTGPGDVYVIGDPDTVTESALHDFAGALGGDPVIFISHRR